MKAVFEDFLDSIDSRESAASSDLAGSTDVEYSNSICFFLPAVNTMEWLHAGYTRPMIHFINDCVETVCENSSYIDDFAVFYAKEDITEPDDKANEPRPLDEFLDYWHAETATPKTLVSNRLFIVIRYNIAQHVRFGMFQKTLIALYGILYKTLSDKYKLRFKNFSIYIDRLTIFPHELTYSYLHDIYQSIMRKDSAGARYDSTDIERHYIDSIESVIAQHHNKYVVNPEGRRLDYSRRKKLDNIKPGEFLYASPHGLTIESCDSFTKQPYAPVAQFVYKADDGTYRFVSLKYMTAVRPQMGSVMPYCAIRFGNAHSVIDIEPKNKHDGCEVTALTLEWANEFGYDGPARQQFVPQSSSFAELPLFLMTNLFAPAGTKRGDWYVPALGEMSELYSVKDDINSHRTQEGLDELADFYYYTSNERDDQYCFIIDIDAGVSTCM